MAGCASLDFPEPDQVPSFETPVAMLELPERRVGRACVENVAYYRRSVLCWKKRLMCVPLWNPYMFNCRTNEEMLVCLKYDLQGRLD